MAELVLIGVYDQCLGCTRVVTYLDSPDGVVLKAHVGSWYPHHRSSWGGIYGLVIPSWYGDRKHPYERPGWNGSGSYGSLLMARCMSRRC